MKIRIACVLTLGLALAAGVAAQDSSPAAQAPQSAAGQGAGGQNAGGAGGGNGQRGGRGGFGGMGMMGRGVAGTVTAVAADHFSVKSFLGETYTVQYGGSTRFFKMPAGGRRAEGENGGQGNGQGAGQGGQGWGQGRGMGNGGNPPQEIKPTDIKVGDAIEARGEVDATAKSVGATSIALMDPERAAQMQQLEANFGKTWLMGKVTAIEGVKVTLTGSLDNAPHSFVADENTTFRRRRDPITLADIQVGDTVRADGAVKDGVFAATTVGEMGAMEGENPRGAGPGAAPGATPPSPQ
jgi:hypothetical protein